ncbi:DUF1667 domain-containing protein [Caproiciproducens sp.]
MDEKQLTCIICPRSCHITVRKTADGLEITGNSCKRGLEFAKSEITNPMRMLTSSVVIHGAKIRRLPVITTAEVPKSRLNECLQEVYRVRTEAPVQAGDVLVRNLCGTGVDLVAARSIGREN